MKPDRTIRLNEIAAGTILHRIASAMVARKGEYTFTDAKGAKVKVIA